MPEITLLSALAALFFGSAAALAGGAISGARIARHGGLETGLGAWMGGFYGPLGAIPGIVVGLIALTLSGMGS